MNLHKCNEKMHEIFQFCCNKSQFHLKIVTHLSMISHEITVVILVLKFEWQAFSSVLMSGGAANISGRGSEAGPMKSFHDVMYVFSCFSNPPFFSHVKLASNQFDVDNFVFISVLTRSHLELELNSVC